MVRIYTSPGCSSCRKVKKWFEENKIDYQEKNIFSPSLCSKDIYEILAKSEDGTDNIISKKSKIIKEQKINVDVMKTSQLVKFILENPSVLKRPIIVDDTKIQVGYNSEEIRVFIPSELRELARLACNKENCAKYAQCENKNSAK